MTENQKMVGGVSYSAQPNLNSDTPWSDLALDDIKYGVEQGQSVARIADFLCRSEAEVAEKIHELGFSTRSM